MSQHAYRSDCECHRCRREHSRRNAQAKQHHQDHHAPRTRRQRTRTEPRPVWGSQEWAETRGDDVGESPDY